MANTAEADFFSQNAGRGRLEHRLISRIPKQLTGDLAASTTIAASGNADEKIPVYGMSRVRVRYKLTGTGLDETVTITPYLADGSTLATTNAASDSGATSATERSQTFEPWGEHFVSIKVLNNNGSNAITVNYIEVQAQ